MEREREEGAERVTAVGASRKDTEERSEEGGRRRRKRREGRGE